MSSMETKWRVLALTAIAPVAWGSGYYVVDTFLPPDRPLFGATVRALPFGLLILALRPALPQGVWWWRVALLGTINIGAFFGLLFVVSYRLPGGMAATLTATSPLAIMGLAWLLAGDRPRIVSLAGAVVGIAGVALLVLRSPSAVDAVGVTAALAAVLLSSTGFVLVKRWPPPVDMLTYTGWQLVAGGIVLLPVAILVEGAPPPLGARELLGFAWLGLVATVLSYVVWFRGLQRLPAAAVGLVGLLNPVAGTITGVALAGERLVGWQVVGIALVLAGVVAGQPALADRLAQRRRAPSAERGPATVSAAMAVVSGTASTSPIEPASERTTSVAISSVPTRSYSGRS